MVSDKKSFKCVVQTVDSVLTFNVQQTVNGKDLLEQACEVLNITESWWFGLYARSKKNYNLWVEDKKKVNLADLKPFPETEAHVKFCVKYYPEDIKTEILTLETKKYFFKSGIQRYLSGEIVALPEDIVLFISGYLKLVCSQKKDLDPSDVLKKRINRLVPSHIASQYPQSMDEWHSMFLSTYELCKDVHLMDVLDDRLTVMENSHMYGISYYDILNKKGTKLLLGVDALGLYVYVPTDKVNPKVGFPWSEIHSVAYEDKKFIISPVAKSSPSLVIYSPTPQQNEELLQRIFGNHEKYLQRRQPNAVESSQFNKAMALRDAEISEKKRFEQQKDANAKYDKAVNQMVNDATKSGVTNVIKQVDMEYEKAMTEMEKRIKEAERIATEEREKNKRDSKEVEELRKKALELEKKVQSEKSAREAMALVESQLSTQAELRALEVERLAAEMEALKMKHEADLSRLKDLENTSSQKTTQVTTSTKTYSETKVAAKANLESKMKSLGDQLQKAQKGGDETTAAMQKNKLEGKDKFKTLELVRKGNTKARIDEFEAL